MDISDISDMCFGERHRSYIKSIFGKTGASPDLTEQEIDLAHRVTMEEMLDEIHFMLRALLSEPKQSQKPSDSHN